MRIDAHSLFHANGRGEGDRAERPFLDHRALIFVVDAAAAQHSVSANSSSRLGGLSEADHLQELLGTMSGRPPVGMVLALNCGGASRGGEVSSSSAAANDDVGGAAGANTAGTVSAGGRSGEGSDGAEQHHGQQLQLGEWLGLPLLKTGGAVVQVFSVPSGCGPTDAACTATIYEGLDWLTETLNASSG